ncbi:MAG: hypothetical protein KA503_14420 [Methyloversatilis sp.]|nr:hypothetical protein [Methyloversatilis sp.]
MAAINRLMFHIIFSAGASPNVGEWNRTGHARPTRRTRFSCARALRNSDTGV